MKEPTKCACVSMDAEECARIRDGRHTGLDEDEDDDRRKCECPCHDEEDDDDD